LNIKGLINQTKFIFSNQVDMLPGNGRGSHNLLGVVSSTIGLLTASLNTIRLGEVSADQLNKILERHLSRKN